jgi:acyl-CoA hydrolase
MRLRDALAAALHEAEDPDLRGISVKQWRKADAILADPAFRAALTEAVEEAVRSTRDVFDEDDLVAAIVARMLDPRR